MTPINLKYAMPSQRRLCCRRQSLTSCGVVLSLLCFVPGSMALGLAIVLAEIPCLPVIFNIGFHKINPADPPLELGGYSYLFDIDKANRLNKVCVMKKENSVEAPKCYSYDASYSLCPSDRNDCLPAYFQLATDFGIVSYSVGFTVINEREENKLEYHIKSDYSDTIWRTKLDNSQDSTYLVWIKLFKGGAISNCFVSFGFFMAAFAEFGVGLIISSFSCILCTYRNCRKMM